MRLPLSETVFYFEEKFRGGSICKEYAENMAAEYQSIKDKLPPEAGKIVDIGCGIAAIDVFLFNHYQNSELELFLIDKTGIEEKVFYGFKSNAAFYNSMRISEETLCMNGVPQDKIRLFDVARDPLKGIENIDRIISLISWGFHYPIDTYLDFALSSLRPGGRLILDVRKGTNGLSALKNSFSFVEVFQEKEKLCRVVAIK
jgi:SAM-dependent methyltransferase